VFGVDGGADRAAESGIEVVEVLGDLDSVGAREWEGRVVELNDQTASDLAKSLVLLIERGFTEIDVVGVDGGEADHVLGNWAAMLDAPPGARIRMHHESRVTTRIHPEEGELSVEIGQGESFSVFALEPGKVWISGSKWDVAGDFLALSSRGLHNEGRGGIVSIRGEGVLVVISADGYSSS
jgi:thiamine pyrophosphokinase